MPDEDPQEEGIPFPVKTGETVDLEAAEDSDAPEGNPSQEEEPKEKLISQAELDRILQKRLKRQEETLLKKYADYDQVKEDAEKFRQAQDEKATDAERWERERAQYLTALQEKEERLSTLERTNLVADMATDASLPKKLWRYVDGTNADEIEESIKQIKDDFDLNEVEAGAEKAEKKPRKRSNAMYGGGGENETPDPDIDKLVSGIPRGPQFRISNSRTYK